MIAHREEPDVARGRADLDGNLREARGAPVAQRFEIDDRYALHGGVRSGAGGPLLAFALDKR